MGKIFLLKDIFIKIIHIIGVNNVIYATIGVLLICYFIWLYKCLKTPGVGYWRYLINNFFAKEDYISCEYCKRKFDKEKFYNKYYCSEKCYNWAVKEARQSFKHDNRCNKHPFQRLTYRRKCFDCYIKEWIKENPRMPSRRTFFLRYFYGFKWIPTLRTSEYSWNGDKIAFDTMLEQLGYKWIVYIKFYIDRNNKIRPIVVGKSGSLKVNNSGCDLSFSTDVSHGDSRGFLKAANHDWYHKYILIKNFKNESQAYKFERKIMNLYGIYGS